MVPLSAAQWALMAKPLFCTRKTTGALKTAAKFSAS